MRKWLMLLSALSGTAASAAPAWTWVDDDGVVHYSDRPVPGARPVELSSAQAIGTRVRDSAPRAAADPPATAAATAAYQSIEILSPADQETLWNIGTTLPVQVGFQPALQPGHRYDLLLDGQRRNVNAVAPSITLTDVFRGIHTLQVLVIDAQGTELARSQPRTFMVQQTSMQNPNSPTSGRN
jgi:hypothetical protein